MSRKPRAERRSNPELRELLDDLLQHARDIARRGRQMSPADLDHAQERLEWLADEIWRAVRGGEPPS